MSKRIELVLDQEASDSLRELAKRMGVEPGDAVRIACGLYAWALDHGDNGLQIGAFRTEVRDDLVVLTEAEAVVLQRKTELRLVKP